MAGFGQREELATLGGRQLGRRRRGGGRGSRCGVVQRWALGRRQGRSPLATSHVRRQGVCKGTRQPSTCTHARDVMHTDSVTRELSSIDCPRVRFAPSALPPYKVGNFANATNFFFKNFRKKLESIEAALFLFLGRFTNFIKCIIFFCKL